MFQNAFLDLCSNAKEKGFPLSLEVGRFVGRGFADLGYEIFSCLPGSKLLSLLTGESTTCLEEDKQHLFSVPTVDQICAVLEEQDVTIASCERSEQREWIVVLRTAKRFEVTEQGVGLQETLLRAYCRL